MRNGFSLMEALVGIALLSISMLAVLALVEQVTAQERMERIRNRTLQISTQLESRLQFASTCRETLVSPQDPNQPMTLELTGAPGEVPSFAVGMRLPNVRGPGATDILSEAPVGRDLSMYDLSVNRLRLTDVVEIPDGNAQTRTYLAIVQIGFAVAPGSASVLGGSAFRAINLSPLVITTDTTQGNAVVGCYSSSKTETPEELCIQLGGRWQNQCSLGMVPIQCPPATFPVSVENGAVRCDRLGLPEACPVGQYLTAVGIESQTCAPLPITRVANPPPPVTPTARAGCIASCGIFGGTVLRKTNLGFDYYADCMRARPAETDTCRLCTNPSDGYQIVQDLGPSGVCP
jgi:type II secretory pathway pseudopilin PulG